MKNKVIVKHVDKREYDYPFYSVYAIFEGKESFLKLFTYGRENSEPPNFIDNKEEALEKAMDYAKRWEKLPTSDVEEIIYKTSDNE